MTAIPFDNSYARLPDAFFARVMPARVPEPSLLKVNETLAEQLGLDTAWLYSEEGVSMLSGNLLPSNAEPISMAYAGHQFGGWVPQLGDGRAILLGEILDKNGVRHDIQLKGSGRTPFSRRGDGKAALGPVLREYLVSEAMAALGVPTTRSLAVMLTGETVSRDTLLPGAILTRVAQNHVRVGTFQYFYAREDWESLRTLTDYIISRDYPHVQQAQNPYLAFLTAVVERQATLIAKWMCIGFIHGVMNTDNMQIAGETIDYGPCAFMDNFHPEKVFSSIDQYGRYAWNQQPVIAQWNLMRLAETLIPILGDVKEKAIQVKKVINQFNSLFNRHLLQGFSNKLGLLAEDSNEEIIKETFSIMTENEVDFTLFFRQLTRITTGESEKDFLALLASPESGKEWLLKWRKCISDDAVPNADRIALMRQANPIFIPRNHRIEAVIKSAVQGNFKPFHLLAKILSHPYEVQPKHASFESPPKPEEVVCQTFCGT
tara:strand:- start:238 stop:1701 length:1464 start_codon:yes stop_codon:yes gene_type:complete